MAVREIATEHPHIVQQPGADDFRPYVRGTGLSVELVARFYRMGVSPDELLDSYPHLTPAALYDALSYYHDHQAEIDQQLDEVGTLERVQERYGFRIGEQGKVILNDRQRAG
jgi:uncharacterized protein (DUF433 family)